MSALARRLLLASSVLLVAATPAAAVEGAIDSHSHYNTVTQPVTIGGWTLEPFAESGTGIDVGLVYSCPVLACYEWTPRGQINLGVPRPDIAAIYGSQFANAGFNFTITHWPADTYLIRIYVHVAPYDYWTNYDLYLVVNANPSNPLMAISTPSHGALVFTPYTVTGWAIDTGAPSGTGVSQVKNDAYHNPGSGALYTDLGAATYGDARPDVSAVYGAAYHYSGFHVSTTLPPGMYYHEFYARSTYTETWFGAAVWLYVDIPTNPLTIDRGGTGTGGISASGLACTGGSTTQGVPCGATYALHTAVTLTPQPDPGSTFAGWAGPCSVTGTTCVVTMSGARYVSATFAKIPSSIDTTYYHTDTVGSVRAITDATGAVVIRHDYMPFGEDSASMTGDPMRFAGKQLDPETALHYFEARYYRQTWGRFSQVDPLHVGAAMTDPQQWNRYAYAKNNPLAYGDPTGLSVVNETVNVTATAPFVSTIWTNGTLIGPGITIGGSGPLVPGSPECTWAANAYAEGFYELCFPADQTGSGGFLPLAPSVGAGAAGTGRTGDQSEGTTTAVAIAGAALITVGVVVAAPVEIPVGAAVAAVTVVGVAVQYRHEIASGLGELWMSAVDQMARFPARVRAKIWERDVDADGDNYCKYCGAKLDPKAGKANSFEADHVVPPPQGGGDGEENGASSCRTCNRQKGSRTPGQWKAVP